MDLRLSAEARWDNSGPSGDALLFTGLDVPIDVGEPGRRRLRDASCYTTASDAVLPPTAAALGSRRSIERRLILGSKEMSQPVRTLDRVTVPHLAGRILKPLFKAGVVHIKDEVALDAAVYEAILLAVRSLAPPASPLSNGGGEARLPAGRNQPVPWAEVTATALAQAAIDRPAIAAVTNDPAAAVAGMLEASWSMFSVPEQAAPLNDASWRHRVAVRTVELLPQTLAGCTGQTGSQRLIEVLAAAQLRHDSERLVSIDHAIRDLSATGRDDQAFPRRLGFLPPRVASSLTALADEQRGVATTLARLFTESTPSAAVKSAQQTVATTAAGPYGWLAVAEFGNAHGMFDDAMTAWQAAVADGAPEGWRYLTMAGLSIVGRDPVAGSALFAQAAELGGAGSVLLAACVAWTEGEPPTMLRATETVPVDDDHHAVIMSIRALAFEMSDRSDDAIEVYETAVGIDPSATSVALLAAASYIRRAVTEQSGRQASDLARAKALALAARDERRRWHGDSAAALSTAMHAAQLDGDWGSVIALGTVGGVDGPTSQESLDPRVQHVVLEAALAAGNQALAAATVAAITDPFTAALARATVACAARDQQLALRECAAALELASSDEQVLEVNGCRRPRASPTWARSPSSLSTRKC